MCILIWGSALPKLFVEINKQYLWVIYADYWHISVITFDSENTELADYSLFNLLFVLRSEGFRQIRKSFRQDNGKRMCSNMKHPFKIQIVCDYHDTISSPSQSFIYHRFYTAGPSGRAV